MELLNTREQAIVLWVLAAAGFIFLTETGQKTRKELASPVKKIIASLKQRVIIITYFSLLTYTLLGIIFLYRFNFWEFSLIKVTIYWYFASAITLPLKVVSSENPKKIIRAAISSTLSIPAITNIIANANSLALFFEILLFPASIILTILSIRNSQPSQKIAKQLMVLLGALVILNTALGIISNPENFLNILKKDLVTPLLLTLLYIPALITLSFYSTYEKHFIFINRKIENPRIRLTAKLLTIAIFNIRYNALKLWRDLHRSTPLDTYKKLILSFTELHKYKSAEKNLETIDSKKGWNPHLAKNFLINYGIKTDVYSGSADGIYSSSSTNTISKESFPFKNISYAIIGTKKAAQELHLCTYFNRNEPYIENRNSFIKCATTLIEKSLRKPISESMKSALNKDDAHEEKHANIVIKYQRFINNKNLNIFIFELDILSVSDNQ